MLVMVLRLSAIVDADEIIVPCDGKIAERATYLQFLHKSGLYPQIWTRQTSGFSDNVGDDNVMIH